jgi:predicted RNA binding protein YcfA (HicA-like mRNA interferase family)
MDPLKQQHVRAAAREGWVATRTRGSHVRLIHPSGAIVICSGTPGGQRVVRDVKADLRRALRSSINRKNPGDFS